LSCEEEVGDVEEEVGDGAELMIEEGRGIHKRKEWFHFGK